MNAVLGVCQRRHVSGVVALLLSLSLCLFVVACEAFSPWTAFGVGEDVEGVRVETEPYRAASDGAASLRELLADYGKRVEWEIVGLENTVKAKWPSGDGRTHGRRDPFSKAVHDRIQRLRGGLKVNVAVVGWMADELASFADRQLADLLLEDGEDDEEAPEGLIRRMSNEQEGFARSQLRAVSGVRRLSGEIVNHNSGAGAFRLPECSLGSLAATNGEADGTSSPSATQQQQQLQSPQLQYGSLQDALGHLARDFGENLADGPTQIQSAVYKRMGQLIVDQFRGDLAAGPQRTVTILIPGAATAGLLTPLIKTLRQLGQNENPTTLAERNKAPSTTSRMLTVELVLTECSRPLFAVMHCLLQACRWNDFPLESLEEKKDSSEGEPRETKILSGNREDVIPLFPWLAGFQNLISGDNSDQLMPVRLNRTTFQQLQELLNNGVRHPRRGFASPTQSGESAASIALKTLLLRGDVFGVDWGRSEPEGASQGGPVRSVPRLRFDVVLLSYVLDAITVPSVKDPRSSDRGVDGATPNAKAGAPKSTAAVDLLNRIDEFVAPGGLLLHYGPLQYHHPAMTGKLTMDEILLYLLSSSSSCGSPQDFDCSGRATYSADSCGEGEQQLVYHWELLVYERLGLASDGDGLRTNVTDLKPGFVNRYFGLQGEESAADTATPVLDDGKPVERTCPIPYARPYRGSLFGNGHFPVVFALRKRGF